MSLCFPKSDSYNQTATMLLSEMFKPDNQGRKDNLIVTEASYAQVGEYLKLNANPNVTFKNAEGKNEPILTFAAKTGNARLVKMILEKGANPNTRDAHGKSCIGLALSSTTVNFKSNDIISDEFGANVLEAAKANLFDRINTVKTLLDHGAKLKIFNRTHETPLQNLICGDVNGIIIKEKIIHVVKFDNKDMDKNFDLPKNTLTPRVVFDKIVENISSKEHRDELIGLLINNKIDVNGKNNKGYTPLHYAILTKDIELSQKLIQNGANVNARTSKGFTPLHIAAYKGYPDFVKQLLDNGANNNIRDRKGKDAIDFSLIKGHKDLALYIKSYEKEQKVAKTPVMNFNITNNVLHNSTINNKSRGFGGLKSFTLGSSPNTRNKSREYAM